MIDYFELHVHAPESVSIHGRAFLIKKDSLTTVEQTADGRAMIRGITCAETYAQVKGLLRDDPRRFVHDGEVDFRMAQLKSMTVREIIKWLPGSEAARFVRELMGCEDDGHMMEVVAAWNELHPRAGD